MDKAVFCWLIVAGVLLCCHLLSAGHADRHSAIKTVQVSLAKLPRLFADNMMLRRSKRPADYILPHIGNIDLLYEKLKPIGPFKTGVSFQVSHLGTKRTIDFRRTINCIKGTNVCAEYPFNLNDLVGLMDLSKRTVVAIGGYTAHAPTEFQEQVVSRWQQIEDANTVIVGWNTANNGIYPWVVANLPVVARQVTVFLHYLAELGGTNIRDIALAERMYFVGHSLGAHISGLVGQDFDGKLGRITGLDPAAPMFKDRDFDQRLDRSDALLVDIIHTNSDDAWNFFLGLYRPIGHLDYYANNGKWQPSCPAHDFFSCNHGAVKHYYISVLDHAISTKENYDHETQDEHRLFGHLAASYEDFRSGRSILKSCPVAASNSNDPVQQNAADIRRCVVPMDFVKPVREFKRELEQEFKIDFGESQQPNKYYFFTSPEQPFVNDHNLLKIQFINEQTKPDCWPHFGWQFKFRMDGLESSELQFKRRDRLERSESLAESKNDDKNDNNSIKRLVVPFLALTRKAKYALSAHDRASEHLSTQQADISAILEMAKLVLPHTIDIRAAGEHFEDLAITSKHPLSCKARLESVRVVPLKRLRRMVVGIYSLYAELKYKPDIRILRAGEPIPSITVMPGGQKVAATENVKLYLDTVVIGPNKDEPIQDLADGQSTSKGFMWKSDL